MSVTIDSLKSRLRELEAALAEVKAELAAYEGKPHLKSLAGLYGAWQGLIAADESDFGAVEFSGRWLAEHEHSH